MVEKEKLTPPEFLSQKKVYFVGSPQDRTVLVAIHPRYEDPSKTLKWWDTSHERAKQIKTIRIDSLGEAMTFTDNEDIDYIFVPMSLALYDNMVRKRLPDQIQFQNEEEMIKAFESTMI